MAGDGAPICFISPELAFLLWDGRTETRDFTISTVSGAKKIKIFSGSLLIYEETQAHTINKRYFGRVYFSPSAHVSAGGKGGYSVLLPACCASVMEEVAARGKEASAAERRRNAAEVNTAEEKPTEEIAAGKGARGKEASAAEIRRIAAEVNTAEEKPTEEIAAGKATHGKGTKTDEV